MVLWAIENAWGGEVLVPKIPLLPHHRRGHSRGAKLPPGGGGSIRPGEKIHEEMITASDSLNTVDLGRITRSCRRPASSPSKDYCQARGGRMWWSRAFPTTAVPTLTSSPCPNWYP